MSPLNGGPAFPWREEDGEGGYNQHVGMTLRDYFAAAALAALGAELARAIASAEREDGTNWEDSMYPRFNDLEGLTCSAGNMATSAYHIADAMLAARTRTEGKE